MKQQIEQYKADLTKNKEYVEQLKAELEKSMAKHHQLLGAIYALENLPKPTPEEAGELVK